MSYRSTIPNLFISTGRSLGKLLGCELAVELSDHSISAEMEVPTKSNRAWDTNLYKSGNVFVAGYSNPIKPRVRGNDELENPDTLDVTEGEPDEHEGEEPDDEEQITASGPHVQLISSGRYRQFMRQDLIEQLLTPETRWNKMLYLLLGAIALQFLGIIVTLYATGSFG